MISPARRRRAAVAALSGLLLPVAVAAGPASGALPDTPAPELTLDRVIRTSPFDGTTTSTRDNEGSAYVARDNSLWVADDDGGALWEVNATTGALKRKISRSALDAVVQFQGTATAGRDRSRDLESVAYDPAGDVLYAFSGTCCSATVKPTVFRLHRQYSKLQLESFQPLPAGSDNTASAWNDAEDRLYVGAGKNLRTYDYATNAFGAPFEVPGLSGVLGMDFTSDGRDLVATTGGNRLVRVDWATGTAVAGWTLDLSPFGIVDPRAVELVGDRFFVSDGYDDRPSGDPLTNGVFVLDVSGPAATAPDASFTMTPPGGEAPLTVQLTDTSTGGVTGWSWDFGDGATSSAQNPSHAFTTPGTYTITLTASNAAGSSTASRQLEVTAPPPPDTNLLTDPGFETGTTGWDTGGYAAVSLDRSSEAHSGAWAARLTNTGAGPVTSTLNDAPDAVQTSSAGTYHAAVWVRGGAGTVGLKVYLRVREMRDGTKLAETVVPVRLTTGWQQVTATLVPTSPGSSRIDFTAALYSAPAGSVYIADDASLTHSP
jgi:PKD repeat protein